MDEWKPDKISLDWVALHDIKTAMDEIHKNATDAIKERRDVHNGMIIYSEVPLTRLIRMAEQITNRW